MGRKNEGLSRKEIEDYPPPREKSMKRVHIETMSWFYVEWERGHSTGHSAGRATFVVFVPGNGVFSQSNFLTVL